MGINAFDQWGVELGKKLADSLAPPVENPAEANSDASLNDLLGYVATRQAFCMRLVLHPASGHTPGMKTAISIPDDVFANAEKLARRLKTSRSELYSRAIAEFLARHSPDEITAAMDRVVDVVSRESPEFHRTAARKVFERADW